MRGFPSVANTNDSAKGMMTIHGQRSAIFISDFPFTLRDELRFGLSTFVARGYNPIILNVAKVYPPTGAGSQDGDLSTFATQNMSSSSELRNLLRDTSSEDLVINVVGLQWGHLRRYRELLQRLSESKGMLGGLDAAPVVQPERSRQPNFSLAARGVEMRRAARSWLISLTAVRSLYRFIYGIRSLDFAWVATSGEDLSPLLIGNKTRLIAIHSLDFDQLMVARVAQKQSGKRLVLIDDLGPDHPDLQKSDGAATRGPVSQDYFAELRLQLDQIELLSGCSVEVAAHPRARPGVLEERYGYRQIHYGETVKLIDESSLILLVSFSTVAGIAVALSKPMMMIQLALYDNTLRARRDALVNYLHLAVFPDQRGEAKWTWPSADSAAYANYMEKFVKSVASPRDLFWKVVIDSVEKENYRSCQDAET